MGWQQTRFGFPIDFIPQNQLRLQSSAINEQCFIRKNHKCGKMFGASKSCFIACPTDDNLETILSLMSEKLTKLGVEPIIAVKERAYGQDIFCTKICGKIIESRFCLIILDDTVKDGINIPNPNVYYEYGLMTALRKHIIPLQKEDLKLAFNIQSHETIKYNLKNINIELDRAIRDTIKLTDATESEKMPEAIADKVIMRKMELAGFLLKDREWFLADAISDTAFRGFGHNEKKLYAYLGKIDTGDDIQTYIDDLNLVVFRTEKKARSLDLEISSLKAKLIALEGERESKVKELAIPEKLAMRRIKEWYLSQKDKIEEDIRKKEERKILMSNFFIAFIITSDIDSSEFLKSVNIILEAQKRYTLTSTFDGKMTFDETIVDFTVGLH